MKNGLRERLRIDWVKSKNFYGNFVRLLKLYLTPNARLSGRQRLRKLRIDTLISNIILVLLIMAILLSILSYYKIHHSIYIENATYVQTGKTSLSCYSNARGTMICCADKSYLTTRFINSSRKPLGTYECYKYEDID